MSSDLAVNTGDIVSFTFVVTNDLGTTVDDVTVQIDLPPGLTYLQHSLSQTFNPATGVWDIGTIQFFQPQQVITIDARVDGEGVLTANAEISGMSGTDSDSTPGNGEVTEDDIVSACVTVPIRAECGQSVRLEAPAGYSGYTWYRDGVEIPGATSNFINVGETGSYNFQLDGVTTTCPLGSCCPAMVSFDSISVSLSQPTVCTGGFDTVFVEMPPVDEINFIQTYSWSSPDDPGLAFLSCVDCAEPSLVIDGTYLNDSIRYLVSVITTDLLGNVVCSANATLTVEVLQAPLINFLTPVYACAEECITIEVTTDLPTSSLTWDGPDLRSPDGYQMTYCPRAYPDFTPQTFVVTATGIDGCVRVDSVQIITMPAFEIAASGPNRACQDLPADLTVSTTPALPSAELNIVWTELPGNPNFGSNLLATTTSTITTGNLEPGDYGFSVSVTRIAPNGDAVCTYTEDVLFTVLSDCLDPSLGGYAWNDANADGIRQAFETPLENVSVQLFLSDGTPTGLTTTTDASGFYEFSGLAVGDYYVVFETIAAFVFSPQNVGADEFIDSDADATGQSDVFSAVFDQTNHLIGVGYAPNCTLAYTNVQTTPSPCGTSSGSLSFDVSGSFGQLTYTWLPNVSSTNSANNLAAGEYTVSVYDAYTECTFTEVLTVPGTTNFLLTLSSAPAACPMGRGGSITLQTDGGIPPFAIAYTGPESQSLTAANMPFTIQDLVGGMYNVTVTDAAGCVQVGQIFIDENPLILGLDTSNVVRPGCNGATDGSFTVGVTSFFGAYTLTLNGLPVAVNTSQPTVFVQNQSAGLKELEVIDGNGCTQTFIFELFDVGTPIDTSQLVLTNVACFGESTGAILSLGGQAYELRNSAGQLVGTLPQNGLPADDYTLLDTSIPGCQEIAFVTLTQPAPLLVDITSIGSDCAANTGSIEVAVAGGVYPYTYAWSGSLAADSTQSGLAPGTYQLQLSDANGCLIDTLIEVIDICEPTVCDFYFTADTLEIFTTDNTLDWCAANFEVPADRTFEIDQVPTSTTICTRDGLIYYSMDALPGDGTDGPYIIEFWYGGDGIVVGEVVPDITDFAVALDESDTWGRWIYDEVENTVRGGQPGRAYGELEVTHVASGQRFYVTPNTLSNQLSSTLQLSVPGNYNITTTDPNTGCPDSIHVKVAYPDPCENLYVPESAVISTPYCDDIAEVCIDVPFNLYNRTALLIDGQAYTGPAVECGFNDVIYYDLAGLDLSGTIFMQQWLVDGRFESARAGSLEELAARMGAFDTEDWTYDSRLQVLRGGNPQRDYRNLVLEANGASTELAPQRGLYDGTRIALGTGTFRAELDYGNGCTVAFSIVIDCSAQTPPQTDTLILEVGVGFIDTLCLATTEIPGVLDVVTNICPLASGEQALVTQLDSTCFEFEGLEIGTDTVCVVACDANGVCDTTIVIVNVLDPQDLLFPVANPDVDSVSMNGVVEVAILANDLPRGAVASLEIVQYPLHGNAQIVDNQLVYEPDVAFCGVDSLVYELCNNLGCDTAIVDIATLCDDLIIYSGFSPNFDDVNETFTVLGIEQYPDNKMEVFNRYGNKVFEMEEYDNSWEGTYFDGEPLPEGTYFYVFEDGKGRTYTGYVYLKR